MKKLLKISLFFIASINVFAQTPSKAIFKKSFSGTDKKIFIYSGISNLTIEGISGTEVILESDRDERNYPAEAEGLKIVTLGAVDNTGVGANVSIEGNIMKIKVPKVKSFGNFTLKIPKEVNISVQENGNPYGKWQISNMNGDVETKTTYSTLNINNVSGPIVTHGGWGKIYIVYDKLNQSKPNSISSNGAIDVTLPADTKANLKLNSQYGEVFSDFDIQPVKIEEVKTKNDAKNSDLLKVFPKDNRLLSQKDSENYDRFGNKMATESSNYQNNSNNWATSPANNDCNCNDTSTNTGIINDGGVTLSIKSTQGNIYLRKKK